MTHAVRQYLSRVYRTMPPGPRKLAAPLRNFMARREAVRQMNEEILPASRLVRREAAKHPGQKIVVDCGFNTGVVLKTFLRELPDFRFYGFEVNPEFRALADDFKKKNANIIALDFAAVSDKDEDVTFWLAGDEAGVHVREGTTILESKQSYMTDYSRPHTARGIDFARWIGETYQAHTTPEHPPFIVVKMDIEGAEVPILEHMIATGAMKYVSVLIVEFHADQFDPDVREAYRRRENNILKALENSSTVVHRWF